MPLEIANFKGHSVVQDDDGRVFWTSGADVDADGSNGQAGHSFAYREDDKGLDALANAGWPNNWQNVLIDHGDGVPTSDGKGNWYSSTTYAWPGRPIPKRYVDASSVPYIVVHPVVRAKAVGIVIGCRGRITYKRKTIDAVVADVSGGATFGELSIAAAEVLGIPSSPRSGGVQSGVLFEFWPGSAAIVNGEIYVLQHA